MIEKNELYKELNRGIIEERLHTFTWNLGKNAVLIERYGGLKRILSEFDDKHAVVIGAGPSLDKQCAMLREYQHRSEVVFITVDMALKALVDQGVEPGYVFSCETVPVDFFSGVDTSRMHLIAFSCMCNSTLRQWQGDISFYNWMVGPEYDRLWERAGRELGFVATGNIITTQAVAFALGCRIKSLILVGNDLGFSDRFYARGSIPHGKIFFTSSRLDTPETGEMGMSRLKREYEILRGMKKFYTNHQFLAAKLWLEDLFSQVGCPVYDCSLPGCSDAQVTRLELKEFFSSFGRKRKRKRRPK
jgi:hypothetical protein